MGNKRKYIVEFERVTRYISEVDAYDEDNAWDRVCAGEGDVRHVPVNHWREGERLVSVSEAEEEGE